MILFPAVCTVQDLGAGEKNQEFLWQQVNLRILLEIHGEVSSYCYTQKPGTQSPGIFTTTSQELRVGNPGVRE